jgi:hypothetical protein
MKFDSLTQAIRSVHDASQGRIGRIVNQSMNLRNWLTGAYMIEYEQGGEDRAEYGEGLLKALAKDLKRRNVKGLSVRNLWNFKAVAIVYPQLAIVQTPSALSVKEPQAALPRHLAAASCRPQSDRQRQEPLRARPHRALYGPRGHR